jgi:hypothetical protein
VIPIAGTVNVDACKLTQQNAVRAELKMKNGLRHFGRKVWTSSSFIITTQVQIYKTFK